MFKKLSKLIRSEKGEMYISDSAKIVIAVVVGAALLAGLVGITNKVILPATRNWFENMFTATDKYVGSIEDVALGIDSKESVRALLGISDSVFFEKYKDDPDVGGEMCEIYSVVLYGGEYYGIDRNELKEAVESEIAEGSSSHTEKELQFFQDWLDECDTAESKIQGQRYDACSGEIIHYYADYEKGEITEEELHDKVTSSAERHGFDGDFIIRYLFS